MKTIAIFVISDEATLVVANPISSLGRLFHHLLVDVQVGSWSCRSEANRFGARPSC